MCFPISPDTDYSLRQIPFPSTVHYLNVLHVSLQGADDDDDGVKVIFKRDCHVERSDVWTASYSCPLEEARATII